MKTHDLIKNYCRISKILFSVDKSFLFTFFFYSIILGILPGFSIIATQEFINSVSSHNKNYLIFLLLYCLTGYISTLISSHKTYVSTLFDKKANLHFDKMLLEKTSKLELQDFETSESYDLIQRARLESGTKAFQFFCNLLTIMQSLITALFSLTILFQWRSWIILVIIFFSAFRSFFSYYIGKKQYEISRERTGESRKRQYLQYLLTNDFAFKELRIFNIFKYFSNKFNEISEIFIEQDRKISKISMLFSISISLLESIVDAALLYLVAIDSFNGIIPIGNTISYIRCISSIKGSFDSVMSSVVMSYRESLYISQFFEFMQMKEAAKDSGKIEITTIQQIELKDLGYKYKNSNQYVLKHINLTINCGEFLLLVGKNGSGKSTLIKILTGFYHDYEGQIYINGINLKEISSQSLQNCTSVFFQDFVKYEMPLRENIALSNIPLINDDKALHEILNIANFENVSLNQQLGYWFDNGKQLSGGEWIKVGIARSFARKGSLYIWDEPNASLDSVAESNIFDNMVKISKNRIGLLVTHRIGSVDKVNGTIVVLNNGFVEDIGSHIDLIKRCNVYREMYEQSIASKSK